MPILVHSLVLLLHNIYILLHIAILVNVNIFFDVFTVFQGNACFLDVLCIFFLFYMFYAVLWILSKKKCTFTWHILQAVFLRIIFYIFLITYYLWHKISKKISFRKICIIQKFLIHLRYLFENNSMIWACTLALPITQNT